MAKRKMSLSKQGVMEIISYEAIVQTRYKDSVGVWTIGIGHTKAAGPPDPTAVTGTLSIADVYRLFVNDVQRYVDAVNRALAVEVTQAAFDALVSFHFNTGAIARASLTKSLNAGDTLTAAAQFLNWNKPPEVIGRRMKEQKLFADGVYSGGGKATVYPADVSGKINWKKGKRIDLTQQGLP